MSPQQSLQLFARTSIKCALALADIAASTYLGKGSAAIIFAGGHCTISAKTGYLVCGLHTKREFHVVTTHEHRVWSFPEKTDLRRTSSSLPVSGILCESCQEEQQNCKDTTSKDTFSQCENLQHLQGIHIQVKSEYVGTIDNK